VGNPNKTLSTTTDEHDYKVSAIDYNQDRNTITKFRLEQALFELPFCNPKSIYEAPAKMVNKFLNQITYNEIHSIKYENTVRPPYQVSQYLKPAVSF